jgi:thiamine biosynthesis lipoprotein
MIKRCQPLLGTFVEIKIFSENSAAYLAVEEAFDEIKEIHNLMSFFDEKSEVFLLNKKAHQESVLVDRRLFEVLSLAKNLFEMSQGLFDVSLHRSQENCCFEDVELREDFSVKFRKKLQIDLGGIAKGYAVDRAALILENQGIGDYIINAGGDLRVGKSAQTIGIRNPQKLGEIICETEICDCSLATTSGYFSHQKLGEKTIYPIFQPRPENFRAALEYSGESFSVSAKNCALADALTKIVAIKKENSAEILRQFEASAMLVSSSNQVTLIN